MLVSDEGAITQAISHANTYITSERRLRITFGNTCCGNLVHAHSTASLPHLLTKVGMLELRGDGGLNGDIPYLALDSVNGGLPAWANRCCVAKEGDGRLGKALAEEILHATMTASWVGVYD